jgi:cyclophilin family peptidyl-prolyl cis-trans isomerase
MSNKEARKTVLYILATLLLISVVFLGVTQLSERGLNVLPVVAPDKSYTEVPKKVIDSKKDYQAIFKTSLGDFTVDLYEKNAPTTVNNFVFLAKDNFYDGVKFHRVVKDFIVQSGSRLSMDENPQNDGVGGPGYRFADEMNWDSLKLSADVRKQLEAAGFKSNKSVTSVAIDKYTLAMANAGANTNGSQFFITTADKNNADIKSLAGKHTAFGKVTSGQDVVDKINNVELLDAESVSPRPKQDIVIKDIEIVEK